ncbi:hypothetical protein ACQP25_31145 [Microtetraspora malaysiensis]|uniref:hypothetical protein n=1 Tax=Microtetraspora malaysiensis TaxID=161358 RepID=UPI003D8B918E
MSEQPTGRPDGPDSGPPPVWGQQPGQPGLGEHAWGQQPGQPGPAQHTWGQQPGQPGPVQYAWGPPPAASPKRGLSKGCLISLIVAGVIAVLGIGGVVAGGLFLAKKVNDVAGQGSPGSDKLPQTIDGLKLSKGGVTGFACSLGGGTMNDVSEEGRIGSYCYVAEEGNGFAMALAGRGEAFDMTWSTMLSSAGGGAEPKNVNGAKCIRDTDAAAICVASKGDVSALVVTSGDVGEDTAAKIALTVAEKVG